MRLKKCKSCGENFETDKPGAYLCPACSLAAKQASVVRPRLCRQCGATFDGGPRAWYCPSCREERSRAYAAEYRCGKPARKIGSTDTCERCGAEYIVAGGRQRYCKACAKEAVAEKVRPHKREYAEAHKDVMYPHKAEMRTMNKVCVVCGKVFDNGRNGVTCSAACAEKRKSHNQAVADLKRGRRKTLGPGPSAERQSGIPGINWNKGCGKWQVKDGTRYIGVYADLDAAKAALDAAKKEDYRNG